MLGGGELGRKIFNCRHQLVFVRFYENLEKKGERNKNIDYFLF